MHIHVIIDAEKCTATQLTYVRINKLVARIFCSLFFPPAHWTDSVNTFQRSHFIQPIRMDAFGARLVFSNMFYVFEFDSVVHPVGRISQIGHLVFICITLGHVVSPGMQQKS